MENLLLQIDSGIAIDWLLKQTPVVVVMGAVIWWLAKKLSEAQAELKDLMKKAIEIAILYRQDNANNKETDKKFEQLLNDILEILKKWEHQNS